MRGHRPPGHRLRVAGWTVLVLLLLATLVAAVTFDRGAWPGLVGDEATYAMQAASLAHDADLLYERRDYDRFVEHWGVPPDGLILQSRTAGARMIYGKAVPYALVLAPVVRFAPVRGGPLVNALLLALTALLVARVLGRRVGPAAPLWTAVFVFASVSFVYVFWVHADLFLLCCTAAGLALAYAGEPRATVRVAMSELYRPPRGVWESAGPWRPVLRWLAVGALLAVPTAYRPLYAGLLLPALLAARAEAVEERGGGGRRVAAVILGFVLLLAVTAGVQWAAGGHPSPYGGERQGFYQRTGFPQVDFPGVGGWEESIRRWGNTSWLHEGAVTGKLDLLDLGLWGWNGLYWLAGRTVGALPYFLPLVLGFAAWRGGRGRWALPLAVAAAVAAFFLLRPFNWYGGGGAVANRYFLPLYPAFWFLAGRAPAERDAAGGRRALGALLVALLAAPFLWPVWSAPRAFPVGEDGRYRHVSQWAERLLPYETTLSHVPGGHDRNVDGLWVKVISGAGVTAGSYRLRDGGPAELLVGSPQPLESLVVDFAAGGPANLRLAGAEVAQTALTADGGTTFLLELADPRAVHPMWWTSEDWYLYQLELAPAEGETTAAPFTLHRATPESATPQSATTP